MSGSRQLLRRAIPFALVCLVLGLSAGAAAAAKLKFKPGNYRTAPPQSESRFLKVSFAATKKNYLKDVKFDLLAPGACSNGGALVDDHKLYKLRASKIKDGRFSFTDKATGPGGSATLTLKGKLAGSKASGTFRVQANINGGVTCDSERLTWNAKRRGK